LHPRGDDPFQVLERIGDNAYKLDIPGEFQVSATFNVADLSLFDVGSNSRTNYFQEGRNDSIKNKDIVKDNDRDDRVLEAPRRPLRAKREVKPLTLNLLHLLVLFNVINVKEGDI